MDMPSQCQNLYAAQLSMSSAKMKKDQVMKILVLYYSRSGRTEKLAQRLAKGLEADLECIECERYEGGIWRYLLAGYDSLSGKLPPIPPLRKNPADYDLVLLGFPIWTSYPAVPIRSYLSSNPSFPEKVGVFITYGGQSKPSLAVSQIVDYLQRPVVESLAIRNKEEGSDLSRAAEAEFIEIVKELGKLSN